jgi:N-acetylglucosaminyldiphosphoundecaprenol N-acetyl-beta-D-mannosaminyltransferase
MARGCPVVPSLRFRTVHRLPTNPEYHPTDRAESGASDARLAPATPASVPLLGVPLHVLTGSHTLDHIAQAIRAGVGGWVVTANLDILRRIVREPETRVLCSKATLTVADGMPLIWASRLQGTPLPERVTGSDLILSLNDRAAREGFRVFLLGGDILEDGTQVATRAAEELRRRFPTISIVGAISPKYGFDKDTATMQGIERAVIDAQPDIVFVAVGFPKQERVIERLRPLLPSAWFLGVGISFSFVTGNVHRAPQWIQRAGLEWLHRFAQEPGRLFKRYFVHGIPFAIVLLWKSWQAGRTLTR